MRNQIILSVIGFILLTACSKEDDKIMTNNIAAPKVTQNAAFEVLITENITYAEGLSLCQYKQYLYFQNIVINGFLCTTEQFTK